MPTGQIPIRVTAELAEEARAYAKEQGVGDSELFKLLFQRERRLRRLVALQRQGRSPNRRRQTKGSAQSMDVITVYFSLEERAEFERYVGMCGLKKSEAGWWLLEGELREHWLQRALQAA